MKAFQCNQKYFATTLSVCFHLECFKDSSCIFTVIWRIRVNLLSTSIYNILWEFALFALLLRYNMIVWSLISKALLWKAFNLAKNILWKVYLYVFIGLCRKDLCEARVNSEVSSYFQTRCTPRQDEPPWFSDDLFPGRIRSCFQTRCTLRQDVPPS